MQATLPLLRVSIDYRVFKVEWLSLLACSLGCAVHTAHIYLSIICELSSSRHNYKHKYNIYTNMSKTSPRLYVPHCPSTFNCSAAERLPKQRLAGHQRAGCRDECTEGSLWHCANSLRLCGWLPCLSLLSSELDNR